MGWGMGRDRPCGLDKLTARWAVAEGSGSGVGEIRTHGTVSRSAVFKTAALNHSATTPERGIYVAPLAFGEHPGQGHPAVAPRAGGSHIGEPDSTCSPLRIGGIVRLVFGSTSRCLGVFLCLFGTLEPSALAAQGSTVTAGTHDQMKTSAGLVGPDSTDPLEGSGEERAGGDSTYNWGAAWIGMGVGAVVGAAVMGLWGAESSEIPYEGAMVAGALLFGIVGFFVGYAIGNHD